MIPKTIHYCWFGDAPKPKSVLRCINSWKKYCPDFEIREWTEKNFDVTQNEFTRQAFEAKAWGFVPDYIRLWIIYNYGGIYLDTDVQVIRNLSPLLKNKAFAGFEDDTYVALGLGFGAEPGDPMIYGQMQQYEAMRFILEDGSQNRKGSPQHTTEFLLTKGLRQQYENVQQVGTMTIYPAEYFCPKNFHTGLMKITPNTYSIHQYDSSWFTEEEQEQKTRRWKKMKARQRKDRLNYWRYLPNRILLGVLGKNRYEKLKNKVKRG